MKFEIPVYYDAKVTLNSYPQIKNYSPLALGERNW